MSIHELPRTPRKKTGGILEKMVMHGVDGDGMDSEGAGDNDAPPKKKAKKYRRDPNDEGDHEYR